MRDSKERAHPLAAPTLKALLRASARILDMLPVATFVCDARGTVLEYNNRAVDIWGRAPAPGQTHDDFTSGTRFYEIDGTPLKRSMLAEVLASGTPLHDAEVLVERPDGTLIAVSVNIEPLRDEKGELVGAVNCFLETTERRRITAALEESRQRAREQEQRLAATYEHAAIGISEVAPDGSFLRVNEAICAITGYDREHLLANRLFTHTLAEDIDPDRDAFQKQIAGTLDFYSIEKRFIRRDGRVIWMSVRSSPVRDESGKLLYLVRVVQDITERKAAEQRAKLLIDELNHRVKNTLATVQSLAMQSARSAATPGAFRDSFEGRLIALSKAHDQLTVHHWESADLRELLTAGFAPHGAGPERVVMRGEDIVLRPRAALALAMTFHELITNAAKYGALSSGKGRIDISWRPAGSDDRRVLQIDWQEQNGPEVRKPERQGFGSRFIEHGLKAELGGDAVLSFAADGVRCAIEIPLDAAAVKTGN